MNLRDTIKETTRQHLDSGEKLLGQCITAVGWVNGTVPDHKNIIELPCTDVSASHIVSGIALGGGRPILIIRFQDFLVLNADGIVNFAAKQKDVWHKKCPIFVRALSQEGRGTGATHSAKLHSMFMHFPGMRVWSPITPNEWKACYQDFMEHDDPTLCCEYKGTFDNTEEMYDSLYGNSEITLVGIGNVRIRLEELNGLLKPDIFHIAQLKPFKIDNVLARSIQYTKRCLVVDSGFEICGAGSWIAQKLSEATGVVCHSIGLADKSCCVAEERENSVSQIPIMEKCLEILGKEY